MTTTGKASLSLLDSAGEVGENVAANPNQRILMRPPFHVEPFDLIRREKPPMP